MSIGAGELTELIRLERETRVANGQGGYDTSWSEFAKAWAQVSGLSGDEALQSGVQRSVQQWRVTIYRRADVQPTDRIVWGNLILDIKAAMPLPKEPQRFTLLICESGLVA